MPDNLFGLDKPAYRMCDLPAIVPLSRTTLYKAIAEGTLRARKQGRSTIILAEDLVQFLKSLPSLAP